MKKTVRIVLIVFFIAPILGCTIKKNLPGKYYRSSSKVGVAEELFIYSDSTFVNIWYGDVAIFGAKTEGMWHVEGDSLITIQGLNITHILPYPLTAEIDTSVYIISGRRLIPIRYGMKAPAMKKVSK